MIIIQDIETIEKPFKNAVAAIGNFDGVHIGHQALLHQTIEKAAAIDGTSMAITFEPHPVRVLSQKNDPALITLFEQKAELIERIGVDVLLCIAFTPEFARISAEDFVRRFLVARFGVKVLIVGKDYAFGKNREGDIDLLKRLGRELGFEVMIQDWIPIAHDLPERISSTRIRDLVSAGKVLDARKLLGRHYQIKGKVVKGRDRGGKLLGFPTANIQIYDELCPKTGVYAVRVENEAAKYNGVANIGFSPTFDDHVFTIEVHLLDFQGDLYQHTIRVDFIERIRDERKFGSVDALASQIRKDIQLARNLLSD